MMQNLKYDKFIIYINLAKYIYYKFLLKDPLLNVYKKVTNIRLTNCFSSFYLTSSYNLDPLPGVKSKHSTEDFLDAVIR